MSHRQPANLSHRQPQPCKEFIGHSWDLVGSQWNLTKTEKAPLDTMPFEKHAMIVLQEV